MRDNYLIIEHPTAKAGMQIRRTERVYICGHGDDFDTMREFARRIQECYEAEIWISKGSEAQLEEGELEQIITGMTMIVVPVSRSFLNDSGAAGKIVIPMAGQHRIRLLPVCLESGIETEFTAKFGEIHLIDYNNAHFQDNLKSYIERFIDVYINLAGDDTAVEDSFSFRIFISYRKKDRALLWKLISTIRQWDEQIATSIWFDDSLIYGENYDEQIREKLESSDLVLLLCTENLLESGNYVLRNEYPDAVASGRKVLPVLMDDTGIAEIEEFYPGLPDPVLFADTEHLRSELKRHIMAAGESAENLDGDRLYYIAKGYASGIGTEKSSEMEMKAIQQSASKGNVWAMIMLVKELNKEDRKDEAFLWAERSFDRLYGMAMNPDLLSRHALGILGSGYDISDMLLTHYFEIAEFEKAYYLLRMLTDIVKKAKEVYGFTSRLNDGVIMLWFGNLYFLSGDLEWAYEVYDKAVKNLSVVLDATHNVYSAAHLVEAHINSGRCLLYMVKYGLVSANKALLPARSSLEKAMELEEGLYPLIKDLSDDRLELQIAEEYHRMLTYFDFFAPEYEEYGAMREKEQAYQRQYGIEEEMSLISQELGKDFPVDLTFDNSLEVLKYKLDCLTFWHEMFADQESLNKMFSFDGFLPEAYFGDLKDSSVASSYKCPICGNRLYRTVFPEGNDPELYVGINRQKILSPARVFSCHCGRIYAVPKGRKLIQGPVFSATLVVDDKNTLGRALFDLWWLFFNTIGDENARRNE